MDDSEAQRMRREILGDVGAILTDHFAAREWGRVLVEVVWGADGSPAVANIDVEEIVGDEGRVDAVFASPDVRALLPALARAAEALCGLDGVSLEDVSGGTFVRRPGGEFAWLSGLVHTPSARFDRERDDLVAKLRARNAELTECFGSLGAPGTAIDLARGTITFAHPGRPPETAPASLVGTFAPATRTWGWGGSNPHVPEVVRRASARIADSIPERDMWEISTPSFATDEATAWAIAALVCDRAGGRGVYCAREPDGLVFVLVGGAL
jgi:hypothetical protein